jgi:hypothetical protein
MATIASDEKIGTQMFSVEIVGLMGEVPNVVSFDMGQASCDMVESTQGDSKNREFNAAKVTYQDAVLTLFKNKASKDISKWFEECKTKKTPRDITLVVKTRDGKGEAYRCTGEKCWPKQVDSGNTSTDSGIPTVTATFRVGRVVF